MIDLLKIAEYGVGVTAILGLLAAIYYFLKAMKEERKDFCNLIDTQEQRHKEAYDKMSKSNERLSKSLDNQAIILKDVGGVVKESHKFLINLNGSLKKAVKNHKK